MDLEVVEDKSKLKSNQNLLKFITQDQNLNKLKFINLKLNLKLKFN